MNIQNMYNYECEYSIQIYHISHLNGELCSEPITVSGVGIICNILAYKAASLLILCGGKFLQNE